MAVTADYALKVNARETFSGSGVASDDDGVLWSAFTVSGTLNASSSPDAESCAFFEKAMSSGTGTIDLTAMTDSLGVSKSISGKKPRLVILRNDSANSITVTEGASNGHPLLGASFSVILESGDRICIYKADGTAVGGSDKTWDLAGTLSQTLKVGIVAG